MRFLKYFLVSILVFMLVITGCSGAPKIDGQNIIVYKRISDEDKYKEFKKITNNKEVQKVKKILKHATWENAKVSMTRRPDYTFIFEHKDQNIVAKAVGHEVWISPYKDKIEIIKATNQYVQLSKEDSAVVFEVLTEEKLSNSELIHNLPGLKTMALPTVNLIHYESSNKFNFDHSYTEVCWHDCDEWDSYTYPDIHSGDVEIGDKIQIDWKMIIPAPSEIYLIEIDSQTYREVTKEKKEINNSPLTITIDEKMIGNQYALEFLWKNGDLIEGRSMLNFKLK